MSKVYFVTGGAGFIGSALVRYLIRETEHTVVNIDKLTYAGHLDSLTEIAHSRRYIFEKIDICNDEAINHLFCKYKPDVVMHLAAESHVDRSIDMAMPFIQTNIIGTYVLLEAARLYWLKLNEETKRSFRFLHVSTDEVYGDLTADATPFTEFSRYQPSSPYAASKASSDHFVRAWHRTYGLPVMISNCSNNYGPYQLPEKLIPLMITNALAGKHLPIYGDGCQIRDWLYVDDHVVALMRIISQGTIGQTYNIGGNQERKNIEVVELICEILTQLCREKYPHLKKHNKPFSQLIKHVEDRLGHDIRYAIDASMLTKELSWQPKETFESGLTKTIQWYLDNQNWVTALTKTQ